MAPNWELKTSSIERIFPATVPTSERLPALSLLDTTTANPSFTSALWLLEHPRGARLGSGGQNSVSRHLRDSLAAALDSYPWWCGQLKSITSINGTVDDATAAWHLPRHARRLDDLYWTTRPQEKSVWNQDGLLLNKFGPATKIASTLGTNDPVEGIRPPLMAIQVTELAWRGTAVAVKGTHPLADITSLVRFVEDWASISRSVFDPSSILAEIGPATLEPELLDAKATGDINADEADEAVIRRAEGLPLHRYDWWMSPGGPTWAPKNWLWRDVRFRGRSGTSPDPPLRASFTSTKVKSNFPGTRPSMKAPPKDRPTAACGSTSTTRCWPMSGRASCVLVNKNRIPTVCIATSCWDVTYEKSPQRIWQAFLDRRHVLTTTWARSGIYGVDFGFGSGIRYADAVLPAMDGGVLIKEGLPSLSASTSASSSWTDDGVDITRFSALIAD
ncbi:transferase family protein [Apiospora saccharicola]|uniref:Transferase family protein n=1 Tax=Apiospora saccharicola TaxID=335842 RepID=A0ABR1UY32_9PEZI